MSGEIVVVSGTGTGVGKTIVTAAVATLAMADGRRVAVLKPAQTGAGPHDEGDVDVVARLAGRVTARELARYPDPLAPATAARVAGLPAVSAAGAARAATALAVDHDLVLVEGAGGLLVRLGGDDDVTTLAAALGVPVLVVAAAGLGTLNATALTTEALRARGVECAGVVIGAWPRDPGLAERCNVTDLPDAAGERLGGVVPEGVAGLAPAEFRAVARRALEPRWGGTFDPARFAREWGTLTDRPPGPPATPTAADDEGAAR